MSVTGWRRRSSAVGVTRGCRARAYCDILYVKCGDALLAYDKLSGPPGFVDDTVNDAKVFEAASGLNGDAAPSRTIGGAL